MTLKVVTMLWDANADSFEFSRCYDESWVMKLHDGVARNLTKPYQFVLFTDRPRILGDRDIVQVMIDAPYGDRPGYGCFVEPFRLDDPMILMGLDTVIVGNIDDLAEHCLTKKIMALPRDPYKAERVCNGVALVPRGHRYVFDEWRGENDMDWLNRQRYQLIDSLFPGAVVSYKACVKTYGLRQAKIVYFHGHEKPHEIPQTEWLKEHWRVENAVNGEDHSDEAPPPGFVSSTVQEIQVLPNTPDDVIFRHIDINVARDISWLAPVDAHDRVAVIVGGGPSLKNDLAFVKGHSSAGHTIFALNDAANFLSQRDIAPDVQIIIDPRPENRRFVERRPARKFLLSSQCHPSLFDELSGADITGFHSGIDGIFDHVPKTATVMGGGFTAGLTALCAVYALGYRVLHLYGYDSSDADDGKAHAYSQHQNDNEQRRLDVWVAGRRFRASFAMYKQAEKFQGLAQMLAENGATIHVHGDGLLPTIAHQMTKGESHGLQAG